MNTFRKLGKMAALLIAITIFVVLPVSAQEADPEWAEATVTLQDSVLTVVKGELEYSRAMEEGFDFTVQANPHSLTIQVFSLSGIYVLIIEQSPDDLLYLEDLKDANEGILKGAIRAEENPDGSKCVLTWYKSNDESLKLSPWLYTENAYTHNRTQCEMTVVAQDYVDAAKGYYFRAEGEWPQSEVTTEVG